MVTAIKKKINPGKKKYAITANDNIEVKNKESERNDNHERIFM